MAGIMDSIRNLFGGRSASGPPQAANEPDTYKDCLIYAEPMAEGGQYRLAATITKEIGGETKTHRLIRADLFASAEEAARFSLSKARQVIDEQGERLFG